MLASKKDQRITSRELLRICRNAKKWCEDADLVLGNAPELATWRDEQEEREGGKGTVDWNSLFKDEPVPSQKQGRSGQGGQGLRGGYEYTPLDKDDEELYGEDEDDYIQQLMETADRRKKDDERFGEARDLGFDVL